MGTALNAKCQAQALHGVTAPDAEQTLLTRLPCGQEQKALRSECPGRNVAGYQPEGNARPLLEHSLAEQSLYHSWCT